MKKPPKKTETKVVLERAYPQRVVFIEKLSMRLYRLVEIELDTTGQVVSLKSLAEDIPAIIYGKYLREIKNQAFLNG